MARRLPLTWRARQAHASRASHHPGLLPRRGRVRARRPDGGLEPRLCRQQLPLHRRARRLRSQPGLQGLRRRRPAHHRPGPGAPHRRAARARCRRWSRRRSSRPRTSASTSTTASTGSACSARSRPTSSRCGSPRASRPSRCSWRGTSGPRTSAAATSRSAGSSARPRSPARSRSKYPKDKILELYLNQIDLGNRAFGVEAASQRYFGKSVRDLNVAEAATLAAIPKAPARYNPRKNPNRSIQRRNTVLNLLRDNGLLSADEAERWKAYPLLLSSRSDYSGVGGVLRRVRPAAARRALRLRPVPARASGSTPRSTSTCSRPPSARSRPSSRRSRAARTASSSTRPISSTQNSKGEDDDRDLREHALPPGPRGHHRGQDRADPRHGGRPRLRRQQVQPRHPGAAAARLHLQADRVLGGDRGGLPALARHGRRLAQPHRQARRAALDPAELRPEVRGPDDAAPGALPVPQHHRHQARHGAGRAGGGERGGEVRHQHAGAAGAVDPHRLGRRHPAGDDRGLHHVRQPRHPHRAQLDPARGGPQRQDRLAARPRAA